MQTVDNFRQRVYDLDEIGRAKGLPTQFDLVYEAHKRELEKEHYGEIVAIDVASKQIVAFGKTIIEAFEKAREKTGKDHFELTRVGFKYVQT